MPNPISQETYSSYASSQKLTDFLSNIFRRVDTKKFMKIFNDTVNGNNVQDIYSTLLARANETKGNIFSQLRMGYDALSSEKKTLAENVGKVMDPNISRDGYVEIGMPGRMIKPLKPIMNLSGRVTVISDNESFVQSGFPRPYDQFHTLDYSPIPLTEKSVDVISCFAGLHHCPEEKLKPFIKSLHKTLRDGGTLLVREHDARDDEMRGLANVIHSVFNAATGVSLENEQNEIRNFKSLDEWTDLLKNNGFKCVSKPLIRDGDSTENALLKFIKTGGENEQINTIREQLISDQKGYYTRAKEQTHLTTVEWFNVESSQNLGAYKYFWDYPYFSDLVELEKNFYKSWSAARKVTNLTTLLSSDYTVMTGFIATLMGTEYLVKGILSLPLWGVSKLNSFLPKQKADRNWDKPALQHQKWLKKYGEKLEVIPFYAQEYLPAISECWKNFATCWNRARRRRSILDLTFDRQTVKNVVACTIMTVDLLFRALNATVVNWTVTDGGDQRTVGLIVKGDVQPGETYSHIEEEGNPYKGIVIDRYKEFENTISYLIRKGVEIVEIAGQNEIQIDLIVKKDDPRFADQKLYERTLFNSSTEKLIALKVNVSELGKFFEEEDIHRIYDF